MLDHDDPDGLRSRQSVIDAVRKAIEQVAVYSRSSLRKQQRILQYRSFGGFDFSQELVLKTGPL